LCARHLQVGHISRPANCKCNHFLYVSICSQRLFARPLQSKSAKTVKLNMEDIFKQANIFPQKLETDEGGEFVSKSMLAFYKTHKIYHKVKFGQNKVIC
jgi:hypothetical protein